MSSNLSTSDDLFFLNVQSLRNSHDQLCVFFESLTMQPLIIASYNTLYTNNNPVDLHPFKEYQTGVFQDKLKNGGLTYCQNWI